MSGNQPIIIKKIKKGGHGGHHGGAWKIAYADFVTAMMAFFLLMWLLNATSEEQKRGIANYFDPITIGERAGGGDGVMMGESITSQSQSAQSAMGAVSIQQSKPKDKGMDAGDEKASVKTEAEIKQEIEAEAIAFEAIKKDLENAVQNDNDLKEWLSNLMIEETPEGLRIQIIDQKEKSMFPSGSSKMYDHTEKLLQHVARMIRMVPNKLSIAGHTDATPYHTKEYSNWELSTDRAHASRRVLENSHLSESRFSSVVGRESKELFIKNDPSAPQNRRISITLLRKYPSPLAQKNAAEKDAHAVKTS